MPAKAMRSLEFGLYFFIHADVSVKKSWITFNKLATDEKVCLIMFKIAWRGAPILINESLLLFLRVEKKFLEIIFSSSKINVIKWFETKEEILEKLIYFILKVFNMEFWLSNKNLYKKCINNTRNEWHLFYKYISSQNINSISIDFTISLSKSYVSINTTISYKYFLEINIPPKKNYHRKRNYLLIEIMSYYWHILDI